LQHIVKLLAKYGADMMSVDKDGLVPKEVCSAASAQAPRHHPSLTV
jgi:hypothetical protein